MCAVLSPWKSFLNLRRDTNVTQVSQSRCTVHLRDHRKIAKAMSPHRMCGFYEFVCYLVKLNVMYHGIIIEQTFKPHPVLSCIVLLFWKNRALSTLSVYLATYPVCLAQHKVLFIATPVHLEIYTSLMSPVHCHRDMYNCMARSHVFSNLMRKRS